MTTLTSSQGLFHGQFVVGRPGGRRTRVGLGQCLLVSLGLIATAALAACKKDPEPARAGNGGQERDAGGNQATGGSPNGSGGSGLGGSAMGGAGGIAGAGGNGVGGAGGKGGATTVDASPNAGAGGRGGGGGSGAGGGSPSDARTDALSASGCDPVHPQNPRAPLFTCSATNGCISSPDGASKCFVAGTGTDATACAKASDCAPGYYCPTGSGSICQRFCFGDEDCPGGTCTYSFGTDQYAGPYQVGDCRPCPAGLVGCKSSCISVKADPNNCGSCGHACGDGQTCCGGVCVAQPSGGCACGGTATDGDGDGVPDCNDVCPANAALSHAGTVTYSVTFADTAQAYADHFPDIKRCVEYAGKEWSKHFPVPHDVSIEVLVDVADLRAKKLLAQCRSTTSVFLKKDQDGKNLFEMGVAHEILTGVDPNGTTQDAELTFDTAYLGGTGNSHFWLDPDPDKRTVPLPAHTADGLSVCMHELGHALGITGWRDMTTGVPTGTSLSAFDLMSSTDGSNFFFAGTTAVSVYGGPVPETYGNLSHVANVAPRPGTDLADDLMHGVPTFIQARYYISDVDVAIMRDVGLPVPGSPAIQQVCSSAEMKAGRALFSRTEGVNQSPAIVLGPQPPFVDCEASTPSRSPR